MPVKKTSISIDPQLDTELLSRDTERSTSLGTCLSRYFYALAEARRALASKLTTPEISLIADVLNGTIVEPWSIKYLYHEIADSQPDGYGDKWQVSVFDLAAKVDHLSYAEKLALVDAIERYWHLVGQDQQPPLEELIK